MKRQRRQATGRLRSVRTWPVRVAIFAIELYRHMVSPLRLPSCRFVPTCSQYAVEALGEFGLIRGSWLAAVRLAKCGPWHRGGWDPVPTRIGYGSDGDAGGHVSGRLVKQGKSGSVV